MLNTMKSFPLQFKWAFLCAFILLYTVAIQDVYAAGGVSVTTDKKQYKTGDDVVVTIRNNMNEPIYYYGLCSLSDCLDDNGFWECELSMCDAPQEILHSGDEKTMRINVVGLIVGDMKYKFEYVTSILERQEVAYSNEFFMINTGKSQNYLKPKKSKMFSVTKSNYDSEINDIRVSRGRVDNGYIAKNFPNQNRPSNQDIIRQKKFQNKNKDISHNYGLSDNEIVLSIRGVGKIERRKLAYLIQKEFDFIESFEEIGYKKGVVQYYFTMDVDLEEFIQRLESARFGSLKLRVVKYGPSMIKCVLQAK